MALSARPLDDGWYGGDDRCLILFRLKNDSNSALVEFPGVVSDNYGRQTKLSEHST